MPDLVKPQVRQTVQSAVRSNEVPTSVGLLFWMAQSGTIIAPWWSTTRDIQLRKFWLDSDHFSGAMYMIAAKLTSVPWRIEPRDMTIKSHQKTAEYYHELLSEGIQFGHGWHDFWTKYFLDLWCQDNGAHAEVIGAGSPTGPIRGPVLGLAHLDASRCTRTSNPIYPLIYEDINGKRYKFHYSRVMMSSQMPSPISEMNSVGLCWLSRCINKAQELTDQTVYKQEKLGSRPMRQILFTPGLMADEVTGAIRMADEQMDNRGLSRFSKTVVLGTTDTDADLRSIDLASLPDGFDEETSTRLGMYVIALTGGFPPRWLWPATTTGATRADAMYQHIAGTGGGASRHLQMMQYLIGGNPRGMRHAMGRILPPTLRIVFDYQDDEQDRMQAEVRRVRADKRRINLEMGMTTVRVEREQMRTDGEITDAQFDQMELEDGRTPSGDDILVLFADYDSDISDLIDIGIPNPLLVSENDPETVLVAIEVQRAEILAIAGRANSKAEKERALWALKALEHLEGMYEEALSQMLLEQESAELEEESAEDELEPRRERPDEAFDVDNDRESMERKPVSRTVRRFRRKQ